jgi:hypothetical protein
MSGRPWWAVLLQWTVWGVVMALVMGWLGRSRLRRLEHTEAGVLRHPRSTLVMGRNARRPSRISRAGYCEECVHARSIV